MKLSASVESFVNVLADLSPRNVMRSRVDFRPFWDVANLRRRAWDDLFFMQFLQIELEQVA